ncbi:prepilin-type N-terminal cleavage/methylation domain-containing protein [Thalassomonas haliotis]|uniref:Prepilin-type N-terminal cleavage/methylation domain-containing protein n=1 Tax=Thalassomonas haliotis TaxID=485448 RepID=A0ABY7VIQ9_9GAMM|nr:prepilin-type N-terminal cleavage/methylation domain-containing protein [Thalassomonas haliotis]WDE13267.1 prepilin-type N-terminal cleavage/methylation domain-containing protein [Thalassomonas haliotis]
MINQVRIRRQKARGFTLIELMIAVTILSLLLFTASYTYSLMSTRWNKELGEFSSSARIAKHLELTQKLLEGIQSYVVRDKTDNPFFFFIGHSNSLLAVSQAGLFSGEYPEVFRLTVVEKENGLVDLIYQSLSTERFLLTRTEQVIDFSRALVLFTDVESVDFNYFGWRHYNDKSNRQQRGKNESWRSQYSGIDSQYMPSKLQLTITLAGQVLTIPVVLETDVEKWLSPYFERDS